MTTINKVNKTETTVDRRVQIRQILEADGVVNSNQLAEMFNVSLMTIYRDLEGNIIEVNDGRTFIQICPLDSNILIEPGDSTNSVEE